MDQQPHPASQTSSPTPSRQVGKKIIRLILLILVAVVLFTLVQSGLEQRPELETQPTSEEQYIGTRSQLDRLDGEGFVITGDQLKAFAESNDPSVESVVEPNTISIQQIQDTIEQ